MEAIPYRTALLAALIQAAFGQTRVDLSHQTRNVDLTSASSTKPAKSGTVLPASCSKAEVFIKTDAPDGANIYVCVEPNRWVAQGTTEVRKDGESIGTAPALDFLTGQGIVTSLSDNSGKVSISHSIDTEYVETREGSQSGRTLLCVSASNSGAEYTCGMHPPVTHYSTGMLLRWIPDVTNTSPATLNIDGVGARPLRSADGVSGIPEGSVQAGTLYQIWYDGAAFRLPAKAGLAIEKNGSLVATTGALNFVEGEGVTLQISGNGQKTAVHISAELSHLLAEATAQRGSLWFASDTGGDDAYTPTMTPTPESYPRFLLFQATTGSSGGTPTISIGSLPQRLIKEQDCSTTATLAANTPYLLLDNGSAYCKVGSGSSSPAPSISAYCESSTTSDTYSCDVASPSISSLTRGSIIYFRPTAFTNVGAATLDLDGPGPLSAKAIVTQTGTPLVDGILSHTNDEIYELAYDGTSFRVMHSNRSLPNATGYQYARLTSDDGVSANYSFQDIVPSSGPQLLATTSSAIDCDRRTVEIAPASDLTLAATPTIAFGQGGQACIIINTSTVNSVTVQDESLLPGSGLRIGGGTYTIPPRGSLALVASSALGNVWVRQQSASPAAVTSLLQGAYLGSPASSGGQIALSAADKIRVQAIYVQQPWTIRRLLGHIQAVDSMGSLCLYSWSGPNATTATLAASTPPGLMTIALEDRAISQPALTLNPGWYLAAITGHQGTLSIRRATSQLFYTPVEQEISAGVTDGSCPATLSGIATNWASTYEWRFGWRH